MNEDVHCCIFYNCEKLKSFINRSLAKNLWYICTIKSGKIVKVKNIHPQWDFPGGAVVKNPPANAGDTGSSPDQGRSHMPRSN